MKIQIDSLQAGRELDLMVKGNIFGHRILTHGEMKAEAERVWKDQPSCCFFHGSGMGGFYGFSNGLEEKFEQNCATYSTKIEDAWKVVEKMEERHFNLAMNSTGNQYRVCFLKADQSIVDWVKDPNPFPTIWNPSAPFAICLAALYRAGDLNAEAR